jgi:hypothetical protein
VVAGAEPGPVRRGAEPPPVGAGCSPVAALDGVPVLLRLVAGWLAGRKARDSAGRHTCRMKTGRFNWILLLVAGGACAVVGIVGVLAGHAVSTVTWFALAVAFLVGAVVLRRMHLP